MDILSYQKVFVDFLESKEWVREPKNLYEPIDYILKLGGKRIRPLLTLMAADVFKCQVEKALPAALSVEVFHNFTLIHDDIMDNASLRRRNETVHEKWNLNTGILSGDAMMILSYQFLEEYKPEVFQKLVKLFSKTAIEVCEGQQLDVDFETRTDVKLEDYVHMISLKTSVLLGAALKMGAIVAEVNDENANLIYNFGLNLGIAFQLQDDLLDAFGNPETFGKKIGGDIIENKKTFLYLKALELANKKDAKKLQYYYKKKRKENSLKIAEVKRIFELNDIPLVVKEEIERYTNKAFDTLKTMDISDSSKTQLKNFGLWLMRRSI